MTQLSAERVEVIFADCLSDDEAHPIFDGIVNRARFDPGKLRSYGSEIGALLHELPVEFHAQVDGGGDGWSFLNACNDRHGNQWTGLHRTMEWLFLLGIATGQARFLLPREVWDVLPGGMPYVGLTPEPRSD